MAPFVLPGCARMPYGAAGWLTQAMTRKSPHTLGIACSYVGREDVRRERDAPSGIHIAA